MPLFRYEITNETVDPKATMTIEADTRDVAVWERVEKMGRTLADVASGKGAIADHYGIAWAAARRHGITVGKRAEFEAAWTLRMVDEGEADPTPSGPSDEG